MVHNELNSFSYPLADLRRLLLHIPIISSPITTYKHRDRATYLLSHRASVISFSQDQQEDNTVTEELIHTIHAESLSRHPSLASLSKLIMRMSSAIVNSLLLWRFEWIRTVSILIQSIVISYSYVTY